MRRFRLLQAVTLCTVWLLATACMFLAFLWLAGAGVLLLPAAFALWLLAAVTTLRKRPGLWPVVIAMPVIIYLALFLTSLLMNL